MGNAQTKSASATDRATQPANDVGVTHVAFAVRDLAASIAFYERYGGLRVVHQRGEHPHGVAWLSDLTRPFAIVLVQQVNHQDSPLGPFGHVGVGCASREEIDRLAAMAEREGCLARPPLDSGPPVGYWAYFRDPDGNILELSFGQDVGGAVIRADQRAAQTK